jgi:nitrite reductase (cytochrome c-552)
VRSPLLNVPRACQTGHRYPQGALLARAQAVQDRTKSLLGRAEEAVLAPTDAVRAAAARGAPAPALETARDFHRKAQWGLDFVAAENSMGFHPPQEAAGLLGEAIDYARQGQAAALAAGH